MATYTGTLTDPIFETLDGVGDYLVLPPDEGWQPIWEGVCAAEDRGLGPQVGPELHPMIHIQTVQGTMSYFYGDVWFDTIHINPSPLNMGVVVPGGLADFYVWNAYETGQLLNSTDLSAGLNGLSLIESEAPPTTLAWFEERKYQMSVDAVGLLVNSGDVTFTFDTAGTYILHVEAIRAFVFAFNPDWKGRITETWEWYTEVIEAYDGTEQRIKLRDKPRRSFAFGTMVQAKHRNHLEATLWKGMQSPMGVPLWMDIERLASTLTAGSTVVTVNTVNADYYVGGNIIFWGGWDNNELGQIKSMTSSTITLEVATTFTWVAGTEIMPVRFCRLGKNIRTSSPAANVTLSKVTFNAETHEHNVAVTDSPTTYQGFSVLEIPPNHKRDLEETWSTVNSVFDTKTHRVITDTHREEPVLVRSFEWYFNTDTAIQAFREWLMAREGKYNACWVPTWTVDFRMTQLLGVGNIELVVEDTNYRSYYNLAKSRRDIMILLKNGDVYYRRITVATLDPGGDEILTLDAGMPYEIAVNDIEMISFLGLHRLSQDKIEMVWHSDWVVTCRVNMRVLNE